MKFSGKVKYLPNGFFSDLADIDLSKIKKEKIILTVGRLGDYAKNTELLIDALIKLQDKLDDWKVYLVGSMTEEFKKYLDDILLEYPKLQKIIVVTGNISNKEKLYKIYAKSSIFVLTSRSESWGLVIPESMHFSNYVITTNCCDAFYEILSDKGVVLGDIVKNNDIYALKMSIENAMNGNFENKGNLAKTYVDANFDWKIISKKLEYYFEK